MTVWRRPGAAERQGAPAVMPKRADRTRNKGPGAARPGESVRQGAQQKVSASLVISVAVRA